MNTLTNREPFCIGAHPHPPARADGNVLSLRLLRMPRMSLLKCMQHAAQLASDLFRIRTLGDGPQLESGLLLEI